MNWLNYACQAVPYWQLLGRSFSLLRERKYLLLLGLISLGGFSFRYQTSARDGANDPFYGFLVNHLRLTIVAFLVLTVLWIAWWVLGRIADAALIRAVAEHDAERPFGFRMAWACGRPLMWRMIGVHLLLGLLGALCILPAVLALLGGVFLLTEKNAVGAVLVLVAILLLMAGVVAVVYMVLWSELTQRKVVLELLPMTAALREGRRLLHRRAGRVLALYGCLVLTGLIYMLPAGVALAILAAVSLAMGGTLTGMLIGVLAAAPVLLATSAVSTAQRSAFLTLGFRRLDIDPTPAYPAYHGNYTPPPAEPGATIPPPPVG